MPPKKIQAKPPLQAKTKRSLATKAIEEEYKVESDDEQEREAAVLPESHGDEVDVQQLVKDVRSATQQRRALKRQAMENERKRIIARARDDLIALHEDHQAKLARLRRSQLEKLRALLQQKMEIEDKIVTSIRTLERAYGATSFELGVVMDGRMQDGI